jgi:membrane-bound metal-dependent hydrolase YbcI (DUF457 family)
MMAPSHSVSGALLFAVAAPVAASAGLFTLDAPTYLVGALVCSGAALLPDLDHPKARLSNSFGVFSRTFVHFFSIAMGGHRHVSHTIWFVILAFFMTVYQNILFSPLQYVFNFLGGVLPSEAGALMNSVGESFASGRGGAFLIIAYLVTMGLLCMNLPIISGFAKSRKAGGFAILPPVIGLLLAWWVIAQSGVDLFGYTSFLPWAVAIGCLAHDIGDMLTTAGVPFFELPFVPWSRNFRIGLPVLGATSSARETALTFVMGFAFLFFVFKGFMSFEDIKFPWT